MVEFPNWSQLSDQLGLSFSEELASKPFEYIDRFLEILYEIQNTAQKFNASELYLVSNKLASDIVRAQQITVQEEDLVVLQYVQMEISISPIAVSVGTGRFDLAYDWFLNGFSDSISDAKEREFYHDRIAKFLSWLPSPVSFHCYDSVLFWSSKFFYYCRVQNALNDVASVIADLLADIILNSRFVPNTTIKAACYMMAWARGQNHACGPKLAQYLKDKFLEGSLKFEDAKEIAIHFTTRCSELIDEDHVYWSKLCIDRYKDTLRSHEVMQIILSSISDANNWNENINKIIDHAATYSYEIRENSDSIASWYIALDQRTSILGPAAKKAIDYNRRSDFLRILASWYGLDETHCIEQSALLFPNDLGGLVILSDNSYKIPHVGSLVENDRAMDILNSTTNDALGTRRTVEGGSPLSPMTQRPGQPDYNSAIMFENILRDFYNPDEAMTRLVNERSVVYFPHYLHPIQPLFLKSTGNTFPLNVSLQVPRPDRSVQKVGIWATGGDYYSEMEADSTRQFFESNGISCHVSNGLELTKNDFFEFYRNPEYDYICVSGHGNFDHWKFGSSSIQISARDNVDINQLIEQNSNIKFDKRRLLLLNICDGGCTDGLGGIQKLGIAPSIASPSQAVISHLWPVEPRTAAAFALTLSHNLVLKEDGFFGAYLRSLSDVQNPWESRVTNICKVFQGDIIDRLIQYRPMENIFEWGSPAYFQ